MAGKDIHVPQSLDSTAPVLPPGLELAQSPALPPPLPAVGPPDRGHIQPRLAHKQVKTYTDNKLYDVKDLSMGMKSIVRENQWQHDLKDHNSSVTVRVRWDAVCTFYARGELQNKDLYIVDKHGHVLDYMCLQIMAHHPKVEAKVHSGTEYVEKRIRVPTSRLISYQDVVKSGRFHSGKTHTLKAHHYGHKSYRMSRDLESLSLDSSDIVHRKV